MIDQVLSYPLLSSLSKNVRSGVYLSLSDFIGFELRLSYEETLDTSGQRLNFIRKHVIEVFIPLEYGGNSEAACKTIFAVLLTCTYSWNTSVLLLLQELVFHTEYTPWLMSSILEVIKQNVANKNHILNYTSSELTKTQILLKAFSLVQSLHPSLLFGDKSAIAVFLEQCSDLPQVWTPVNVIYLFRGLTHIINSCESFDEAKRFCDTLFEQQQQVLTHVIMFWPVLASYTKALRYQLFTSAEQASQLVYQILAG
jgi:hypothetical protein